MKFLVASAALCLTAASVVAARDEHHARHSRIAGKRQAPPAAVSSSTLSASAPAVATGATTVAGAVPTSAAVSGASSAAATVVGSGGPSVVTVGTSLLTILPVPTNLVDATSIPSLTAITSGMQSASTLPVTATYTPGASPPIDGAPALPTAFVFSPADWPQADVTPPTDSPEVLEWMKELDGWDIPDIPVSIDGTCAGSPASVPDAQANGWWTCGGWTRDTDIVACPDKLTWGVSFDDGPSPYTQTLLEFLNEKDINATFFVVGSRVIERPQVLIEEYMSGHEISVHTWAHPHLTTRTNAQIVAELGWSRKAIQTVLGVTPTTMRPPYGDIDDRVRAIALAMGMVPIIWTRTPEAGQFDTNDWRVAGGLVTGPDSFASFEAILGNATEIDTGFIVLEHDLFQVTVDLAMGYTLPAALAFQPQLKLESIGKCQGWPNTDLYLETTTNTTFPYSNSSSGVDTSNGTTVGSSGTGQRSNSSSTSADQTAKSGAIATLVAPGQTLALASLLSLALLGLSMV